MISAEYIDLIVKGAIAFILPIGLTFILYPFIRKLRRSWPILLVSVTTVSFVLLFFKETKAEAAPAFGVIVAYTLGIIVSLIVISFVFAFNAKWLETPTEDNRFILHPRLKRGLRLRHLLRMGVLMEERGQIFYGKLAEKTTNPGTKELCKRLQAAEIIHKRFIMNTLFQWLPMPLDKEYLILFDRELNERGIYFNPPAEDSSEEEMAKYAIEQEGKMAGFYYDFEEAFPDAWKRMHLEKLVEEEKQHAEDLLSTYPQLRDTSL